MLWTTRSRESCLCTLAHRVIPRFIFYFIIIIKFFFIIIFLPLQNRTGFVAIIVAYCFRYNFFSFVYIVLPVFRHSFGACCENIRQLVAYIVDVPGNKPGSVSSNSVVNFSSSWSPPNPSRINRNRKRITIFHSEYLCTIRTYVSTKQIFPTKTLIELRLCHFVIKTMYIAIPKPFLFHS